MKFRIQPSPFRDTRIAAAEVANLFHFACQPPVALRVAVWNTPLKRILRLLPGDWLAELARACECKVVTSWEGPGLLEGAGTVFRIEGTMIVSQLKTICS